MNVARTQIGPANAELEARLRQQAVVAELSRLALAGADLRALMDRTAAAVAQALDLEYCKVLELLPGGTDLILRAGVGWRPGLVGQGTIGAGADSQAGYTLSSGKPVIVKDLRKETRFKGPNLLLEHGIVSGLSVVIGGPDRPFGVIGAHTRARRLFTAHDVSFVQTVANLLAGAVQRKQADRELAVLQERLAGFLAIAPDAIVAVDQELRIVLYNRSAEKMLGWSAEEALGQPLGLFVPPDQFQLVMESIDLYPKGDPGPGHILCQQFEITSRRKNGEAFPVELSLSKLGGHEGFFVMAIARDISERKRFEEQLVHFANHDPLTGVYNRRRFQEELERELAMAQRYGAGGAVMILDMDQFKDVNDTLGHRAGDEVLMTVARSLRERLRATDVVARLGGDEFAIMAPRADRAQAQELARQALRVVAANIITIDGQPSKLTASAGIALFPRDGRTVDDLLASADIALYQAKRAGRGGFAVYEPASDREAHIFSRRTWEHRIRAALDRDEFVLHVQPILELKTDRISRYELLLRMRGPDGELVLPEAFLGVAERLGLMREIDRWVVRRGVDLIAERSRRRPDFCLEVNLSSQAFSDPELLGSIQTDLTGAGIDPRRLILEITETAAIANINDARRFIETLNQVGCRFALDDFGIGYSSFSHLKHLPVDCLKIDGGFIADLPKSPVDRKLVSAIAGLAHDLGKTTIAEYVGDARTVELLRDYGVDYAQGYHIGRPRDVSEL